MAQRMLSIQDISKLMNIGIHQAERLVKSNGFPKIKIGRRYFIPEDEYEKWIQKYCYSLKEYKL